jgi:hypothetical protein
LWCRFTNLTGTDYSEGAVELAGAVAERRNMDNITFLVDDVLDSKLNRQFRLVTDKGTLDAIGLHPDGVPRRFEIWSSCLFSLEYADNVSRLKFEQYNVLNYFTVLVLESFSNLEYPVQLGYWELQSMIANNQLHSGHL